MIRRIAGLCLLGAGTVMPAVAAPLEFAGNIRGEAGYAQNPFLVPDDDGGSVTVGGRIDGSLTAREATSTTTFASYYNRQQYLGRSNYSDDLGVSAARKQTFSERLTGNARVGYTNTRNAFSSPIDVVDQISIGSRRKAVDGSASLSWMPTARDSFTLSGFGSHASYSGLGLGDYDSYGGTLRYDRTISDRTTAGASVTLSRTHSDGYGNTDTIQPNFNVMQKLSSAWTFNGSVGLIFQKTEFGGRSSNSKSVGFNADLCGTYPRWSLCAGAGRQTSASGFGGLRTETSGSLRYSYTLDERSRVTLTGVVGESKAEQLTLLVPKQRYASIDAGYSRDLDQRFSVGGNAGYRYRKFDQTGSANGFVATINLSAKIGRLR